MGRWKPYAKNLKPLADSLGRDLMKSEDLELNGEEQRCLGELFHEAGKFSRAADFYRRAHVLSPEGSSVLYSLASIQR